MDLIEDGARLPGGFMFCAISMIAAVVLVVILEVLIMVMVGEGDSRFWDDLWDEDGSDPRR